MEFTKETLKEIDKSITDKIIESEILKTLPSRFESKLKVFTISIDERTLVTDISIIIIDKDKKYPDWQISLNRQDNMVSGLSKKEYIMIVEEYFHDEIKKFDLSKIEKRIKNYKKDDLIKQKMEEIING